MAYEDRAKKIMEMLQSKGAVHADEISQALNVSLVTVRKDLQRMEEAKLLRRTHGGAAKCAAASVQDPRNDIMERIAERVAQEIAPGDCVIINAGSTTFLTAKLIRDLKDITIITNSIAIARELMNQPDIKLLFLGGEVSAEAVFTHGWDSVKQLEQYKANKLILSVSGLNCTAGLTTRHMEAADLFRMMIARTQQVIAVADDTKIGFESFYHVCELDAVDILVTNTADASEAELQKIEAQGVTVCRC